MCSNTGVDLVTECVGFSGLPAMCLKNIGEVEDLYCY